jgi:hypothetical protein
MAMAFDKLLLFWQMAASDLNIQFITHFNLLLKSGHRLDAIFLLPQFGGDNGMLIFGSYDDVALYRDEILEAGYGFSILDEPLENEDYCKEDYIEILTDWGWSGTRKSKPNWFLS